MVLKSKINQIKGKLQETRDVQSQHIVALDIGTEFVKALVGRLDGEKIEILGVGRQRQRLSDMHSGAIADIAGVVENCDKALTQAEKRAQVSARRAIIGIAGELVKGSTTTIKYQRPDPEKEISLEEMELIIQRVQDRAHSQAKSQLAWETGNSEVDIKLVNSAVVGLVIDGYKVTNPIGFKGKNIAIQIFTAFAPMLHIGALERTASELDLELIAVAAEPFAVARSIIGTDASNNMSAILLDVGGGTTDIAVLDDGGVQGTRMFGIGGRAFTRTIASDLDIDFDLAEDVKLNFGTEKLSESRTKKVKSSVDKTLEVWLDGVELGLSEFTRMDHLPNKILLCGGGASLNSVVNSLKEEDWYKNLPFTKKPSVHLIEPDQVVGIVDTTSKIKDHTYITAMGLLRVGYDTIESTDGSDSLKDRVNKMLRI